MFAMVVETGGLVRLSGRLDAAEADRLLAGLEPLSGPVIVDFAELVYISSAGLSVMLTTHKRLLEVGHALRLVNLQPRVRNVFQYAGLDRILQIE